MGQGDSLLGVTLDGKYRMESLLGAGSMGTVYRARHLSLESWRAIKVMRAELAQDADFVERFQREARLLEELRHPNLVALHDFAQLPDGAWYIVSEFVEGETLAARLARTRSLAADEAVRLFTQLADGIAAAHAKGVVHRDLSPDNIMISGTAWERVAKVLDFGLAKSVLREASAASGYSLVVGKIGYAAPEQMGLLASAAEIDARADVFSLAAVLYRALFGRLPWRVDGLQSYVHDLLIQPEAALAKRIVADLPRDWGRFFARALARRPEERTPTARAFRDDLEQVARRQRIQTGRGDRPPKKRRWALALFGGAAALLFTALAFLGGGRGETPVPTPAATAAALSVPSTLAAVTPATTMATAAPAPAPLETRSERASASSRGGSQAPPRPTLEREIAPPAASSLQATLVVRSSPEAEVRVDDEPRGRTPLTLSVTPGSHRLRLVTAEGEGHEEDVALAAGATVERDHRFPGFGSLTVTSQPWVEVSIDDGPFEQTPFAVSRIPAGRHTLRGRRAGWKPLVVEAEVAAGETRSLRLTPERE